MELLLTRPGELALVPYDEPPLAADEVRAVALVSAISHGTELSLYRGTSPFHERAFDTARRLFVDAIDRPTYPMRLGYEWVGRVTAVGTAVADFRIGDMVHLPLPHRQTQTFVPAALQPLGVAGGLPEGMAPERAAFIASACIALQAVHDARVKVGDRLVIFGAGTLGLLALQLARLEGVQTVAIVDPLAFRRELALALGADAVLDPTAVDVGLALKQSSPGCDTAIEFSGSYAALHEAIRSVRMGGTVVAAGFYQGGAAALRLGEEWLHNRVTMVASMRGWGNAHRDNPLWDRARVRQVAIALLAQGAVRIDDLITQRIPFERAPEAYALVDQGAAKTLKVLLTYGAPGPATVG